MSFESFFSAKKNINETFINSTNAKKNYRDERFWTLKIPEGSESTHALIRFLPAKNPEKNNLPYLKKYEHFFKDDNGRWCVTKCPRTFKNSKCPICEYAAEAWKTGTPEGKEKYYQRKARESYIFNILIVNDVTHPELNGKVMLYKCSSAIFKKIIDGISGSFGQTINPFEIVDGNNFHICVRYDPSKKTANNPKGMPDYSPSQFDYNVTTIANTPEEFKTIWDGMIDLDAYNNEDVVSYDSVKEKADIAFGKKDFIAQATGGLMGGSNPSLVQAVSSSNTQNQGISAPTMNTNPWEAAESATGKAQVSDNDIPWTKNGNGTSNVTTTSSRVMGSENSGIEDVTLSNIIDDTEELNF